MTPHCQGSTGGSKNSSMWSSKRRARRCDTMLRSRMLSSSSGSIARALSSNVPNSSQLPGATKHTGSQRHVRRCVQSIRELDDPTKVLAGAIQGSLQQFGYRLERDEYAVNRTRIVVRLVLPSSSVVQDVSPSKSTYAIRSVSSDGCRPQLDPGMVATPVSCSNRSPSARLERMPWTRRARLNGRKSGNR